MENHYGIAVKNRFLSMVDIDDDPLEFLKQQEATKVKKEKAKSKQSGKKSAAQSDSKVKEQNVQKKEEKERTNSAKPLERGGRGGRREPREIKENDGDKRPPRRQGPKADFRDHKGDENVPPEFRERPEGSSGSFNREGAERGRGRGRGRGGFRGGGGGRGGRGGFRGEGENRGERQGFGLPPGERKRDFDRHSGSDKTGIKAVEKKDGGGARNWGSYKDDMVEPHENEETPPAEESTENIDLNESGEAAPAAEVEDQPKQMTLDEWKALQKNERSKPTYKIRKPGEGDESGQWSKGTAYTKKRSESEEEEEDEEEDEYEEDKRHINKNLLDIKITFNDPVRRGRGGRRPRDGRGRGRGMGRSDRKPRDSAPRMDDENDFPRLVKTEA